MPVQRIGELKIDQDSVFQRINGACRAARSWSQFWFCYSRSMGSPAADRWPTPWCLTPRM
ncbi:hypothetical protein BH20CHL4_BH20CHL4_09030 [soil metagenome]